MSAIGGYEILGKLGQGGMGTVYRARAADGSVVAVKLLHFHLGEVEEFVKRFHREALLAAKLAHPNVVRVLADGEEGGQHYLVMELVEGKTLTELMHEAGIATAGVKSSGSGKRGSAPPLPALADAAHKRPTAAGADMSAVAAPPTGSDMSGAGRTDEGSGETSRPGRPQALSLSMGGAGAEPLHSLPAPQVIGWMRQIAGVLQAASDIGLVHRDLKPQNIIIDGKGNARLLDFGLAKDTAALVSVYSATGQSLGTPPYMSPEQCEGTKEIDSRSDLYSLGATAYHLLTGEPPFAGPTQSAFMRQHLEDIPTPAVKLNPSVPLNLSQVIDRLLAKRPEDRHQTAADLIEDLNRVERGEVPLKLYKAKKSSKHGTAAVVGAAVLAGFLVVGVVAGWLVWRSQRIGAVVARAMEEADILETQGQRDDAIKRLDAVVGKYQESHPDDLKAASDRRTELRRQKDSADQARLAKQSGLVADGDARLKELKYAEALAAYQQAAAQGETDELTAKIGTAEKWKTEVEAKIAAAEASRRADEQRQQETSAAETTRQRDFAAALAAATRFLGEGEDTLDQAREQSVKARDLARSPAEIAAAVAAQDQVAAALAKRRPWAAVVDFTLDGSVKLDLTGSAVAEKLEQALGGSYRLVARSQVDKAVQELRFQASDLADRTKMQEFGKQVGAEYLVTGTVVQLGGEATVAAQILKVGTGAIRQTAENTAVSADELDSAFFAEIAHVLSMTMEEKAAYLAAKPQGARGPTAGRAWTVAELGLELLWVAPGSFQMGSEDGGSNEKPVHPVRISRGFWLGRYKVTQAEYEAVAETNPSSFKGARNPVEMVSWNDASAFCAKLTERERGAGRLPAGYEYRLPTEAEWEYAARGGTVSKGYTYAGSNNADEVAWYDTNSGKATHPVGQKKPNELGLYDMSGNVWEWCLDWYDAEYYGRSPNVDPANTQAAAGRVVRGGDWRRDTGYVRSAYRYWSRPDGTGYNLGFRACLAPQSEGK